MKTFTNLLLIDIDGLRDDVFRNALAEGEIPHLAQLVGGSDLARGTGIPALAPAPSVTFCSQACLFTGSHPKEHGVPGNEFFDRFGDYGDGTHVHGTDAQLEYLSRQIDPMIGQLWEALAAHTDPEAWLLAIFSDHGQIDVIQDDRHSLEMSFPFDLEMSHLFKALGLDVHDKPGEDPNCDAVVASNGGLAHVYLQNRVGRWGDKPDFKRDVLPGPKLSGRRIQRASMRQN